MVWVITTCWNFNEFFFTKNTNLAHVIKQLDNFPSRHLQLLSLFIWCLLTIFRDVSLYFKMTNICTFMCVKTPILWNEKLYSVRYTINSFSKLWFPSLKIVRTEDQVPEKRSDFFTIGSGQIGGGGSWHRNTEWEYCRRVWIRTKKRERI